MLKFSDLSILIPAAGFGTRVGSPVSKEMLSDPLAPHQPLIDWSLQQALTLAEKVCIISREDKTNLNIHLESHWKKRFANLSITYAKDTKEWPDSLLQSQAMWSEWNLVLLPDSRFEPIEAPRQLLTQMLEHKRKIGVAVFQPQNGYNTWGTIARSGSQWMHCEKPQETSSVSNTWAWGLFAFHREYGVQWLEQLLTSTLDSKKQNCQWLDIPTIPAVVELQNFKDLTR